MGAVIDHGSGQSADQTYGSVAGRDNVSVADIPPRLAALLERTADTLQRVEMRVQALEIKVHDNILGESLERARQQQIAADRHAAEQAILLDGLGAIREQIADANAALATQRASVRRAIRRLVVGLAIVALIIVVLLADRAWAIWLASLGGAALAYLRYR